MKDSASVLISACLVLHNEEELIERCLKSLVSVVDEIIVVHDGFCIDKTLTICQAYGALVFEKSFCGLMEEHLPFAFAQARGEWILQIDADEFLSKDLALNLRSLAQSKDYVAYEFLWPLFNGQNYFTKNWPYKRCFFQRSVVSFLSLPHFIPEISGKIKQVNFLLEHKPKYNNYSWSVFKKKWRNWAIIQASIYLRDFSNIPKFNYKHNTWPKSIIYRRNFSVFVLPIDFCIGFFKNLLIYFKHEKRLLFKISLLIGCYRALIDWEMFKKRV